MKRLLVVILLSLLILSNSIQRVPRQKCCAKCMKFLVKIRKELKQNLDRIDQRQQEFRQDLDRIDEQQQENWQETRRIGEELKEEVQRIDDEINGLQETDSELLAKNNALMTQVNLLTESVVEFNRINDVTMANITAIWSLLNEISQNLNSVASEIERNSEAIQKLFMKLNTTSAFSVDNDGVPNIVAGQPLNFINMDANVGDDFSLAMDRYTAPCSGTYVFILDARLQGGVIRGVLRVNEDDFGEKYLIHLVPGDNDGPNSGAFSVVLNLAENDFVDFLPNSVGGLPVVRLSGFLLFCEH